MEFIYISAFNYFYNTILPLLFRVVLYFDIQTVPSPRPRNYNKYIKLYDCIPVFFTPQLFCTCTMTVNVFARLSAGLLRQATYTTTRLGIYTILFEKMTGSDGRPPSFIMKVTTPHWCT